MVRHKIVDFRLARVTETLVQRVLAEAERSGTWRPRSQDELLAAMGQWMFGQKG